MPMTEQVVRDVKSAGASPSGSRLEFYTKLPKVHIHTHILGMVQAKTVVDLANENAVDIGVRDPNELYKYYDFRAFVDILHKIAAVMRKEEDFSRVMYEALAEDYRESRVLYSEIFVQTAIHVMFGVPFEVVIEGYQHGVRRAEREFGVKARLIEGINRSLAPFHALTTVQKLVAAKPDYFIGIGLEDFELSGPPELFAPAFELARAEGLHRTAHAGEHGPARNIVTALETLKCERIDHGYQAVTDPSIFFRLADNGVHFTVCPTVSSRQGWSQPQSHVLERMRDGGMWISVNADDPAIINTTLAKEYLRAQEVLGADERDLAAISLAAIDATWLPGSEKRVLREAFIEEYRRLPELSGGISRFSGL